MLKKFFDAFKNQLQLIEKKGVVDFDKLAKIEVAADIAIVYMRLAEAKKDFEEVFRVADSLLQMNIDIQTRKYISTVKARVQSAGGKPGAVAGKPADKAGVKPAAGKPGAAAADQQGISVDQVINDIVPQVTIRRLTTSSS